MIIIILNDCFYFLLSKALWIATVYEMFYINKLALPYAQWEGEFEWLKILQRPQLENCKK